MEAYKCQFCTESFKTQRSSRVHAKCKHRDAVRQNWLQCPKCKKYFATKTSVLIHKKMSCSVCEYCNKVLKNRIHLGNHVEENHPEEMSKSWTKCSVCEKIFRDGRSFSQHWSSKCRPNDEVAPDFEKAYKCHFCTESFKSQMLSWVHAKHKHRDAIRQNWHQCPKCKKHFATKTSVLIHKKMACSVCEHCNKVLKNRIHFGNHMEENHPKEMSKSWTKCSACDKIFRAGRSFSKHWFICRPNDQAGPDFEKAYKCQFCTESFKSQRSRCLHALHKHRDAIPQNWLQCPKCKKYFATKTSVLIHKKMSCSVCEHCNKVLKNRIDLGNHMEENHPEEMFKSWTKCSACDENFRAGRSFNIHLSKCQPNEVGCQVCHKMFSTKEVMLAHVSAAHPSNEKAYKCQFCTESFKSPVASLVHARLRHNDAVRQNWLQCPKCKKYFATKTAIHSHKSNACLACEHCNKLLKNRIDLGNHMEENHPEEMSKSWTKCSACDKNFRAGRSFSKHWFKCRQNELGCQVCLKMFSTKEVMLAHVSAAHPSNDQVGPDFEKAMCQFCEKMFIKDDNSPDTVQYYKHAWREHRLAVELSWKQCQECQVFVPDEAVLEEHMIDSHPRNKSIIRRTECVFCQKVVRRVNYYQHARSHHPNEVQENWVKCSSCDDKFPDQDSVLRHSYILHSHNTCQLCNKVFKRRALYQKHIRSAHSTDSEGLESSICVKCQFCTLLFKSQKSFVMHARGEHYDDIQQKWFPCPDCKKYFATKETMFLHNNVCSVCEYCNKLHENRIQLGNHIEDNHPEEMSKSWTKCSACDKKFRAGPSFKLHWFKCRPKEVGCPECKKMFSTKKIMLAHVSANHPSNVQQAGPEIETVNALANQLAVELCWKQCKVCKVFLPDHAVLAEHMLDSHPSKESNILTEFETILMGFETGKCQFCEKMFIKDTVQYYEHAWQEHQLAVKQSWKQCQECHVFLPDQAVLEEHMLDSHPSKESNILTEFETGKCQFCEKMFIKDDNSPDTVQYYEHARQEHQLAVQQSWKQCQECHVFLPDQAVLEEHIKNHPSKVPNIIRGTECMFCKKNVINYYKHARRNHPNEVQEAWVKCSSCNDKFPTQDIVDRHSYQQHSTRKCQFCSEEFQTQLLYHKHFRSAHIFEVSGNTEVLKNYSCHLCDKKFISEELMTWHLKFFHKQNENDNRPIEMVSESSKTQKLPKETNNIEYLLSPTSQNNVDLDAIDLTLKWL
jgi:hypothetical protein